MNKEAFLLGYLEKQAFFENLFKTLGNNFSGQTTQKGPFAPATIMERLWKTKANPVQPLKITK